MTEVKTSLTFWGFLQELEKGKVAPAYFFFGPEDVLVGEALNRLKEIAIEPGTADFNWDWHRADADEMNWAAYADALTSLPLLASHRVVVLKQAGKAQQNKTIAALIERAIKNPAEDLTLVFVEEEPDLKKAFFKKLADHCINVAFPYVKPAELQRYLQNFASGFDKVISDEALECILADSSPGLRDLLSKLEVLIFYIGDKKTIAASDVEECSSFSREVEVYRLLEAIGRRDGAAAKSVVQRLLQGRSEVGGLIFLLYRQTWALYRMKYLQEKKTPAAQWSEQLDLKPAFLERRYREDLPHYSRQELGKSLEILAQADRDRKTFTSGEHLIFWSLVESLLSPMPGEAKRGR